MTRTFRQRLEARRTLALKVEVLEEVMWSTLYVGQRSTLSFPSTTTPPA